MATEPNRAESEREALLRLEAARRLLDALIGGQWRLEPEVVELVADLVRSAARWTA